MKIMNIAAPALSALAVLAAAAVADVGAETNCASDNVITLCVWGSDAAFGTECLITVDGTPLVAADLVPGENFLTLEHPAGLLDVQGDEVLGVGVHPENPGIN